MQRALQSSLRNAWETILSPPMAAAAVTTVALGYFVFGACATTLCIAGIGSTCVAGPAAAADSLCGACGGGVAVAPEPAPARPPAPVAGASEVQPTMSLIDDGQAY